MKFNRDCKSFLGNYACEIMTSENLKDCEGCKFYEPYSKKILIIKLGAMGDVLRTTPILAALKKKYRSDIHITWLVKEESLPLLQKNPHIDKILIYNSENLLRLRHEKFNILINLDIETAATLISNEVNAGKKFGYYFHKDSHPAFYNKAAEYYLNRVFSNYVNKNNRKTYQEMMFEIAELPYEKETIILNNIDHKYAENFLKKNNLKKEDKILGINIGSSGRWISKAWHQDKIIELIKKLKNYKIILLAGPEEKELLPELVSKLRSQNIKVITNNPDNTVPEFISIINICSTVITGDSLALHISTALKKKTIALFFCTPPWEIEDYNLVKKIISPLFEDYFYSDQYHEDLVKSISVEQVLKEIQND